MSDKPDPLELNAVEQWKARGSVVVQGVIGAAPWIGPFLAAAYLASIPDRRIERLKAFARKVDTRLTNLEKERMEASCDDEELLSLVEQAIEQASRASTERRLDQLASAFTNSLGAEERAFADSEHLMKLLGQINDTQVILLRGEATDVIQRDMPFHEKHAKVLQAPMVHLQSSKSDREKGALHAGYKHGLAQLGLLRERIKIDGRTKEVSYRKSTSYATPELAGYDTDLKN